MKLIQRLVESLLSNLKKRNIIPFSISEEEIQVRCIGHHLYYSKSKKKLKPTAFLPPIGRHDVSFLRLKYTTETRCKEHAKSLKIATYTYCGLSIIVSSSIFSCLSRKFSGNLKFDDGSNIELHLKATPLDINGNLNKPDLIYQNDEGLPFHSDLIYNWTPVRGTPAPEGIKKIAKYLSTQPPSKYYEDLNVHHENWDCGKLTF